MPAIVVLGTSHARVPLCHLCRVFFLSLAPFLTSFSMCPSLCVSRSPPPLAGQTGNGKSELLNCISRTPNLFEAKDGAKSVTTETISKVVTLDIDGAATEVLLVDTPGLSDSQGRDAAHLKQMVDVLKPLTNVKLFLVVFNSQAPRFDHPIQEILQVYQDSFGKHFWRNVMFAFTKWSMGGEQLLTRFNGALGTTEQQFDDLQDDEKMEHDHQCKNRITDQWNAHVQGQFTVTDEVLGGNGRYIPSVMIDSKPARASLHVHTDDALRLLFAQFLVKPGFSCANAIVGRSNAQKIYDETLKAKGEAEAAKAKAEFERTEDAKRHASDMAELKQSQAKMQEKHDAEISRLRSEAAAASKGSGGGDSQMLMVLAAVLSALTGGGGGRGGGSGGGMPMVDMMGGMGGGMPMGGGGAAGAFRQGGVASRAGHWRPSEHGGLTRAGLPDMRMSMNRGMGGGRKR